MVKLVIRNPNANVVLIDDTYENMTLREKGSFMRSVASGTGNNRDVYLSFPIYGDAPPIIAIRPVSFGSRPEYQTATIHSTTISGGVITFLVNVTVDFGASDNGLTVEWFLFDRTDTISAGSGVVVLRNKITKRVTFDSDLKYMRVRDFYTSTVAEQTRPYISGRKYACSIFRQYYIYSAQYEGSDFGDWSGLIQNTRVGLRFVDGAMITRLQTDSNFFPGTGPMPESMYFEHKIFTHMIIDVTNF